ncbi:xanthine dehydrogenase family protein molybdopterin-binding subunit [Paenarthrobacter nitroguajacolicus]|uniref:xanthine dehydrogenase family protein molybdopterin-binding subunit n=1 Tax=Paenarthrobacter nitroguajacolicus TaxID=211146 RepID=UPI003415FD12
MNIPESDSGASLIGTSVPRVQDDRMLRGDGWYVDDIRDAGVLHAAILRSPIAAGRISGFDAAEAQSDPTVSLVLGPDDLDGAFQTIPAPWLIPGQQEVDFLLFDRVIRYVGQPVAVVVAESRAAAEDAIELIDVTFDESPAVVSIANARALDAPLVHHEIGSNMVGQIHLGNDVESLNNAFESAHTVIDREYTVPRISHNSMEPRGLVAEWIPSVQQLTVHSSTQVPHLVRQEVARALSLRADQVRVVAPDVGGAFGLKTLLFPDEALVCLASKTLGTRVKWIEDRAEALVSSYQGRGQLDRARLALDENGIFLALHVDLHGDVGAYSCTGTGGTGPFQVSGLMVEGPYRYSLAAAATVTAWYTNAVPTGAFRGYGMQEATYVRERLIDEAARVLGLDPVELRRRNMIPADELPFVTRLQMPYDSGDYPQALERASTMSAGKNNTSTARIRRGIGYSSMTEITGFAPSALCEMYQIHWSSWDSSKIRINEDGSVTVFSGLTSVGQGIETALGQIAAETLGVPMNLVAVQLGDTAVSPFSNMASQASRAVTIGGAALPGAAERLRERMLSLASAALKSDVDQVTFDGLIYTTADNGQSISWTQVAHRGWMGWGRKPADPIALEELGEYDPPSITYGYATHAAQVAVDLDTGKVAVEAYWLVHDAGVVVNPRIVEGQILGGVAMGFGSALLEEVVYSEAGQPLTTTYLDYILPASEDIPDIEMDHMVHPSPFTPGGFKGAGESGTIPTPGAIANAVAAAVPEIAEDLVFLPMSPSRIWTLLDKAGLAR